MKNRTFCNNFALSHKKILAENTPTCEVVVRCHIPNDESLDHEVFKKFVRLGDNRMKMSEREQDNRRAADRFAPQIGYTRVVIATELQDAPPTAFEGHAYDISLSGLRFELDEPLETGDKVVIELHLPGLLRSIRTTAHVVRILDEDGEAGPRRMAATFHAFESPVDATRLTTHLGSGYFGPER
ncbi:MAG: PilZ domain-containing protein [Phycisphaerales bacterium]|nr:PilZ domain-containing protein [Phycisphaerales bacterium]